MITRPEIFVQILSEVSGKPRHMVACQLAVFRKTHPGLSWDRKMSRNEAHRLLADLRKDAPAIMSWVAGRLPVCREKDHEGSTGPDRLNGLAIARRFDVQNLVRDHAGGVGAGLQEHADQLALLAGLEDLRFRVSDRNALARGSNRPKRSPNSSISPLVFLVR